MWVKLSGASTDIIKRTGVFQEQETIKFSRYGKIVGIPAVLGCIAATYAVSTLANNPYVYIPLGILWFGIILAFDMFLSSTQYKSSKPGTAYAFYTAVFTRLLMAGIVGVVISHPLVLLLFDGSIKEEIVVIDRKSKAADIETSTAKVRAAEKPFQDLIDPINQKITCNRLLVSAEQSYKGEEPLPVNDGKGNFCGYASGKGKACGTRCKSYIDAIRADEAKVKAIEQQRDAGLKGLGDVVASNTARLTEPAMTDYLKRTETLEAIGVKHKHIEIATLMLMLTFVIMDCLIVIGKATTPIGPYEYTRDILLDEHVETMTAQKEANIAYTSTIAKAEKEIAAKYEVAKADIQSVQKLISSTLSALNDGEEEFKKNANDRRKSAGFFDFKRKQMIAKETLQQQEMFDIAREKAMAKLMENLEKM
jgi:Domain of unknown function (DUF4407)